jgi:hypothetical protein
MKSKNTDNLSDSLHKQNAPLVVKYNEMRMHAQRLESRGGKRPGAGRKPRKTPRKVITVRIEPEHADKLRDLCKASLVSQSTWISDKIKRASK